MHSGGDSSASGGGTPTTAGHALPSLPPLVRPRDWDGVVSPNSTSSAVVAARAPSPLHTPPRPAAASLLMLAPASVDDIQDNPTGAAAWEAPVEDPAPHGLRRGGEGDWEGSGYVGAPA